MDILKDKTNGKGKKYNQIPYIHQLSINILALYNLCIHYLPYITFIDRYNKKNHRLSVKRLLLLAYLNKHGCFHSDNLRYNLQKRKQKSISLKMINRNFNVISI